MGPDQRNQPLVPWVQAMEDDLRLSVIIPTHDTRELTLRCLAALRSCNPQPYEVIVVDDGSTDDTA